MPPAAYRRACAPCSTGTGILLISDEVVTGFGHRQPVRCPRLGVAPDIMAMAKGINPATCRWATLVNERVASACQQRDHPLAAVMHGYTYSGHPLACAAANASTWTSSREDLPGNAARVGATCWNGWRRSTATRWWATSAARA